MGDRGGKKNKDKNQKQKVTKHEHEMRQKKDHLAKSTLDLKNRI